MTDKINNDEIFIIKRMVDGDKRAFKYFFEKYYTELCNFVFIYMKDKVLAEEVVQDIFVYFWENKEQIQVRSSARAYLFGASKYRSLNLIREQKNREKVQSALAIHEEPYVEQAQDFFTNTDEFKKVLHNAVQKLPEQCRNIFLMSKQEDLSNKEIARELGLSVKTVENQITIALKKLKACLEPHREKIFLLFLISSLGL